MPHLFDDLTGTERPSEHAVVVELRGPTRAALGCFGATTGFLALIALAALAYATFGVPPPHTAPTSLRVVAGVLGGIFLSIVVALVVIMAKEVRSKHGLALDEHAVWWRQDRTLVRLPWPDVAAARLVTPPPQGARSSVPRTPSVELCPVDSATIRRYPALTERVTAGEPIRPDLPSLRFTFRLPSTTDAATVADAIARLAPAQWAAGTTTPSAD